MKSLLLPLAMVAGLSGCVAYGDPGYSYGTQGYGGYAQPGVYPYQQGAHAQPGYVYGAQPVYRSDAYGVQQRGQRDRDGDGIPNRHDADRDGDGVHNSQDRYPNNPQRY